MATCNERTINQVVCNDIKYIVNVINYILTIEGNYVVCGKIN